jgi:hypothetical protein
MQLRHSAGLGVAVHAAQALALSPLHWLGKLLASHADCQPSAAGTAAWAAAGRQWFECQLGVALVPAAAALHDTALQLRAILLDL